jgi:alginate O-acetyltransferase complex protein AlgI
MILTDPQVLAGTALLALLVRFLPPRATAWCLALGGLGVLTAVSGPRVLLHLGLVAVGLLGSRWVAPGGRWSSPGARPVRAGLVLLVVLHLLAWKLAEVLLPQPGASVVADAHNPLPGAESILVPLGLSFLSFRLIHLLVERARGTLPDAPAHEVLAWLFFPPLLLAGPLMRFGPFQEQLRARASAPPGLGALNLGLLRIGAGLFKKLVVADGLGAYVGGVLLEPTAYSRWEAVAATYGAGFQLYMDFSGYSDVAIGLGALFGLRVPENFDWPLLARDLATLWRRWHITLYTFFRDYVLLPFFGVRASRGRLVLGVFVTVFLFQIWHRLSPAFVFLGFYHALGVLLVQEVQQQRRKRRWLHRTLQRIPAVVAIAFTVSYFCAGVVVFMVGPTKLARLLGYVLGLV